MRIPVRPAAAYPSLLLERAKAVSGLQIEHEGRFSVLFYLLKPENSIARPRSLSSICIDPFPSFAPVSCGLNARIYRKNDKEET